MPSFSSSYFFLNVLSSMIHLLSGLETLLTIHSPFFVVRFVSLFPSEPTVSISSPPSDYFAFSRWNLTTLIHFKSFLPSRYLAMSSIFLNSPSDSTTQLLSSELSLKKPLKELSSGFENSNVIRPFFPSGPEV